MSPRRRKRLPPASAEAPPPSLEHAHQRLAHLYEVSKLFTRFEGVERTFDAALGVIARTLPLRSAMLIETEDDQSRVIVWAPEDPHPEGLRAAREHIEAVYAYLVGAGPAESLELREEAGLTPLPRSTEPEGDLAKRCIVIPLVVARRPLFGVLQLEGVHALDEADLMFVNAIANQLGIALDRDRAWRRDVTRRAQAEEGRTHAEVVRATAEEGRIAAERARDQYEALADENARLYEQARRAVREREQILAIVSHDLRSPLGTILLSADALAAEQASGEPPPAVGRIQRAGRRMQRLIEDLLDFANIEAGRLSITSQLHDPSSMIREVLTNFEGAALAKRLHLSAEVEPGLPSVDCDRDRVLQVLSGLVDNAIKATGEGGRVTLRVEARAHELVFAVSDSGAGISEESAKHLFEPYWRSGEATYKGTGLGLAIAKGIVAAHGGRIWVEGELGRGATLFFTLPLDHVVAAKR